MNERADNGETRGGGGQEIITGCLSQYTAAPKIKTMEREQGAGLPPPSS